MTEVAAAASSAPPSIKIGEEHQPFHVQIRDFLQSISVDRFLIPQSKLIVAPTTWTAKTAMHEMLKAHVSSIPVYEQDYELLAPLDIDGIPMQASIGARYWLGFVDCMDLAALALETEIKENQGILAKLSTWFTGPATGERKEVGTLVNMSNADPFYGVRLGNSLTRVVETMARGVHRVAIVAPDADYEDVLQVIGIVTQSQVIRLLSENLQSLGDFADLRIEDTWPRKFSNRSPVLTASATVSARQVLELMLANKFTAIPLVDESQAIVTSISASDIRALCKLSEDKWKILDAPALEFVSQMRRLAASELGETFIGSSNVERALTVNRTDTIGTLLNLMAASHLHRVYVVDNNRHPVAIISLTDIMAAIKPSTVSPRSVHAAAPHFEEEPVVDDAKKEQ